MKRLPKLRKIAWKLLYSLAIVKIPSITRLTLDKHLKKAFSSLTAGTVLDVGAQNSPYKNIIPYTKYMTLDIDEKLDPDICCDVHNINWQSNYFDVVIATEVLEHLYNPQKAIDEIYRVLKPGGICIVSTPFFYIYHPDPKDYYRFTWDSLNYLFRNFSQIEIKHHGNRLHIFWQLIHSGGIKYFINILRVITPLIAKINFKKTRFPLGFVVISRK